jgi:beta-galactosidase GanA
MQTPWKLQFYWQQVESQESRFDFTNMDQIVKGARDHNLHVVLLWFGTWKNGNMHYVPAWVKTDPKRFPRVIRPDGEPIDVLSPLSRNTLEAGKTAFLALMRHLKQIDGEAARSDSLSGGKRIWQHRKHTGQFSGG